MKHVGLVRTVFELCLVGLVVVLLAYRSQPTHIWHEQVVYSAPTTEKLVALTYDDGPRPSFTPQILDALDKYHVKATFFMIGEQMEKYPEIVKEVQARGHVIGNHTYTHPRDLRADSRAEMKRELEKCEEVIERVTGERARLFRPPWGVVDGTMLSIAEGEGYRTILWTLCADHQEAPTPALMAKRVAELVRPGDIVLLHDGTIESRIKDVEATPLIIEGLLAQGYRFVTVPKLLKAGEESEAGSWGSD